MKVVKMVEDENEIMLSMTHEDETAPPNPEFGDGLMDLTFRRAWLIEALRGTGYVKATGMLYESEINGFCCIGVGAYLLGAPTDSLIGDSDSWYQKFIDRYGTSVKTQRYLVSMNDGTSLRWPIRDTQVHTYGGVKLIRPENRMRSFREIARFLEIIWGIGD